MQDILFYVFAALTLLCGERSEAKRALLREIKQEDASFQIIPIRLSRAGLRVWKTESGGVNG